MPRRQTRAAAPPQKQGMFGNMRNPFSTNAPAAPPRHAPPPPKPVAHAPAPVPAPAPAPAVAAPAPAAGPGLLAQAAATAGGVAVGSTIGRLAGDKLSSMFGGGAPAAPPVAAPAPMAAPAPVAGPPAYQVTAEPVAAAAPAPQAAAQAPLASQMFQATGPIAGDAPAVVETAAAPPPPPPVDTSSAPAPPAESSQAPCAVQLAQFLQCSLTQPDLTSCAGFLQALNHCKLTFESNNAGVTLAPQFLAEKPA